MAALPPAAGPPAVLRPAGNGVRHAAPETVSEGGYERTAFIPDLHAPNIDERAFRCALAFIGVFKPDPGLFLHAAQVLGVAPAHCAVVEDSLPGVQAGLAAGMQVFTVHPREGMPPEMAEGVVFIAHLGELAQWLPASAVSGSVRA